jgi:hypothetical protein
VSKHRNLISNYVTADQLARDLGKHVRTISRWLDRGHIIGTKLGGTTLVDIAASRSRLAELSNRKNKTGARMPRTTMNFARR